MRTLSMMVRALLVILVMGITSCGDDKDQLTVEQEAYIKQNKEYIWEKKAQKEENGELTYRQVIISTDTALYRIVKKENDWQSYPTTTSTITVKDMVGQLISGQVFQPKANAQLKMNSLIPGFAAIMLHVHPDETVEMIIPSNLGYGNMDQKDIPAGSTLLFTLTLDKIQ